MKKKTKLAVLVLFAVVSLLSTLNLATDQYSAATSYTNAKEFYESTALENQDYHVDMVNGTIYYATCAKLASSSTNLRYKTIGFDIELSGNGHSVSFTIQQTGGSMKIVDQRESNNYGYILYAVEDSTLFRLATVSNPTEAAYVLDASVINVTMNAILTTRQGNSIHGSITENGSGGFIQSGTIYRLKNSSDLLALKRIFTGHGFESYKNITKDMSNNELQIRYHAQGLNSSGSTSATAENGFSVSDGFLLQNGSTYIQKQKILQQTRLLSPTTVNLQKTGYHLDNAKEWITNDGRIFSSSVLYMPKDIDPIIGTKSHGITLYANWQANTYTVSYHANGGMGTVASSSFTYDMPDVLRTNTFSKTGYYLEVGKEWNTSPDGTGTDYASGEQVANLCTGNGGTVTLYANWKPVVVSITTDKKGGSGGTDTFYEQYGMDFYADGSMQTRLSSIWIPTKTGYTFVGYYGYYVPVGQPVTNANGTILVSNTSYTTNSTIYASYEPKIYTITFDKQGGIGGTDSVQPTYDEVLPSAEAPVRTGYTFQGYYTRPNGAGTCYYNPFMASDTIYQTDSNMTLYAHWKDETPPDVFLNANFDTWTNQTITLHVRAIDYGSGLSSVQLYRDGVLVANYQNLNGVVQKSFSFSNTTEGVILYKAVAIDLNGNRTETELPVYYDIKAPTGQIIGESVNGNTASFTVNVTDINVP